MDFNKKQFYLSTPAGDVILAEVVKDEHTITIFLGPDLRIDLDRDSALELADGLLFLTNDESDYSEQY